MKKIFLMIMLLNISYVYAIEDIEINGEYLIPKFEHSIKEYNYYTDYNRVNIAVKNSSDEEIYGNDVKELKDGKNIIRITSSNNEEYVIKVFKNYKRDSSKGLLENLSIEGYNLNFKQDIHEYFIHIDNEDYLNIKYTLSNDNVMFSINGNGNFNKSDNIIKITVNDEEYIVHALKSISVSHIEEENKELDNTKKEIVILLIFTISCLLVCLYFYSLFIFN